MKVVYDGWHLANAPNSPAAIHLLTLLEAHPDPLPALIALPAGSFHKIPGGVESIRVDVPNTASGRLKWDQFILPRLARMASGGLIHTVGERLALFGSVPGIASPAGWDDTEHPGGLLTAARLGDALARGGLSRARSLLWPADLPNPEPGPRIQPLPPVVHPLFRPMGAGPGASERTVDLTLEDLPETYLLYHGPADESSLRLLLESWSWAAGAIGGYYPLLLIGVEGRARGMLVDLLEQYELTGTAWALPRLSLQALAGVYGGSTALFHPEPVSVWGDPARLALASGCPVIGLDSDRMAALVGPAAYLSRRGGGYAAERRGLGAALITVVVESSLAQGLSAAAVERSTGWEIDPFRDRLLEVYAFLAGSLDLD